MSLWSAAPWTLRIWVAAALLGALLAAALQLTALRALWSALVLALAYFMLRGVRWLWLFNVAATALYFLAFLLTWAPINAALNLAGLALLLAPPSRRYFRRRSRPQSASA